MKNVILLIVFLFLNSCSNSTEPLEPNDFSLFLVKKLENKEPYNVSLGKLILEEEPILSLQNITSYDWSTHKILFSDEAKENIKTKEPLYSRVFVVEVKGERIYWGKFLCGIYSGICNNPVIQVFSTVGLDTSFVSNSFVIERGYPEYTGKKNNPDLREDYRIYNILHSSGKLK